MAALLVFLLFLFFFFWGRAALRLGVSLLVKSNCFLLAIDAVLGKEGAEGLSELCMERLSCIYFVASLNQIYLVRKMYNRRYLTRGRRNPYIGNAPLVPIHYKVHNQVSSLKSQVSSLTG